MNIIDLYQLRVRNTLRNCFSIDKQMFSLLWDIHMCFLLSIITKYLIIVFAKFSHRDGWKLFIYKIYTSTFSALIQFLQQRRKCHIFIFLMLNSQNVAHNIGASQRGFRCFSSRLIHVLQKIIVHRNTAIKYPIYIIVF